ncbi:MAG: acyl carrier protein [Gammaproteobacteria bacterium]|nr:acyl carrier protein [Gammaproteobacteria bacterium]
MMTEQDLIGFLTSDMGVDEGDVDASTLLFSDGILDSVLMVDLIQFIETKSGIRMSPTEVNLDNLDSVGKILAYVEQKG